MPRITKNALTWENLLSLDDNLSSVIDNYKIEQAKNYNYKGEIVPNTPLDIARANRKEQIDKLINYATTGTVEVAGLASIYLGYAALAAGPGGWAMYGAYALTATGCASIAAGIINHMNQGQWNDMIHTIKLKLGQSGAVFNENLREFYNKRIQEPLLETARTLKSDESNYTFLENKEMKQNRNVLSENIDRMLSKQNINFPIGELALGHEHFIKSACNFQNMMKDMIHIHKNGNKGFEAAILSEKLANQFSQMNKEVQDGMIKGYLANFVASLALVKEAVDKNTEIKSIKITEKEGCTIS